MVDYRPRTIAYQVKAEVDTVSSNKEPQIEITSPSVGRIVVRGKVPEGYQPVIRIYGVEDSVSFARTLLIEALERAGIKVEAAPSGVNPSHRLPESGAYKETERVALLVSPPYEELAKLILKVSHNLGADMTPLLIAVKNGKKTLEEGLAGYITAAKGRELAFALYVNNTPMQTVDDLGRIGSNQGRICEVIYTNN